ncbi:MAG: hypothetical protein HY579_11505 [Nitrospinae bacterium]|nr:hypothetical protein [Nitrospinota bacterium]
MSKGCLDARFRGHDDFWAKRDFFGALLIFLAGIFNERIDGVNGTFSPLEGNGRYPSPSYPGTGRSIGNFIYSELKL